MSLFAKNQSKIRVIRIFFVSLQGKIIQDGKEKDTFY